MAIRKMSLPDILSRFPLSKSAFIVTSFLSTNTHCRAFVSPLLGAEKGLDIFLSHFPYLVLHEPCPSQFYLTSFPHPPRITQQALISHLQTTYTLHIHILHMCFHTWQHENIIVEVTVLHFQKAISGEKNLYLLQWEIK